MNTAASVLSVLAQLAALAALLLLVFAVVTRLLTITVPWVLAVMILAVDIQGIGTVLQGRFWPAMTCVAATMVLARLVWVFWPRPVPGQEYRVKLDFRRSQ